MCEPSHSIIQYTPEGQDDDDNTGGTVFSPQAGSHTKARLLEGLGKWSKKIKGWMHLSMMGSGHSETLGARTQNQMYRYDNIFWLYEAHWWNRSVKKDGIIGNYYSRPEATSYQLDAATSYANNVSIGGLHQLRNFLEQSLLKTDRAYGYVNQFRNGFLNEKGRHKFDLNCEKVLKVKPYYLMNSLSTAGDKRKQNLSIDSIIKFIIGFTRKRDLIVPEWADDTSLWTPTLGKLKSS